MNLIKDGNIVYDKELLECFRVFKNRVDAGRKLAEACKLVIKETDYVFAVPRGGVPVGVQVANALKSKFDLIICRKLLIPWNREAGFGAVDPDGNVFVDDVFVSMIGLSSRDVEEAIKEQLNEIRHRNKVLRGGKPYPNLSGKSVILVDDGIAAGYTMSVALNFVKNRGASKVFVAVPTGSYKSVIRLANKTNLIICLNLRSGAWFAVADAYKHWYDLTDDDVIKFLKQLKTEHES